MLWGLDELLGSHFLTVTETPERLEILSTSLGLTRLLGIGAVLVCLGIGFDTWRSKRGWRNGLPVMGVLGGCFAVMAAILHEEIRLEASGDRIVVERRGILGDLWVDREEVEISALRSVGIGWVTLKAPTRNGTPTGEDSTGYRLRLRSWDNARIVASPAADEAPERIVPAVRALLARLEGHPALRRPLETNLHRYVGAGDGD